MINNLISELLKHKNSLGEDYALFAIADGNLKSGISDYLLSNSFFEHENLFTKEYEDAYDDNAPFIVQLDFNEKNISKLLEDGIKESWITFLFSNKNIDYLAKNLRLFTIVPTENAKQSYIVRWYDARVIEKYCTYQDVESLINFFDTISGQLACMNGKDKLNVFSLHENKLKIDEILIKSNKEEIL